MRFWMPLVALLLVFSTVRAEDAKRLYERATADYNLGHFHEAALAYEEIYRLHPDPVLLYNIGQAYRQAGNAERALFFYRGFLRNQPNAENREEVKKRIADLEQIVATQKKPPNEPAPISAPPHSSEPAPAPAVQPEAVVAAPAPAPALARTPVYKKWWLWTVVGVAVAAVAVGVGVGVTQSGPSPFNANLPQGGPGAH